ncbi:glycosyltransferase family 2 protein [Bifidobacterium choerinum]|uniref:Glycosyl transferase family 2 n=1 Tax=Bifidobacterium choerinum TaxID=35760 RepID=A0A087ADZ0_9BIFI|nr:glycosyltransferase [Bifidobacterium choerinum]KFI56990.1 glycosyl transferase family 2 [Bifidobacterium choerinum]
MNEFEEEHQSTNIKISVIVPVHNVRNFLPRLFDSLEKQDLTQAEVLFVDDGSTDGSGELLDAVAQQPHFVVRHQENKGVAAARNAALDIAHGEYICFVDPDDDISDGYVAALRGATVNTKADVLITDWWECRPGKTVPMSLSGTSEVAKGLTPESVCALVLQSDLVLGSLWAKAFAAKLFEGNRFPLQRTCSDFVPCMTAIANARTVAYVPNIHYSYTVSRKGSLQNSKSERDLCDFVDVHETVAVLIKRRYPELQPLVRFDLLRSKQQACMSACTSSVIAKRERRAVFKRFHRGLLSAVPFMWTSDYPIKGKLMYTAVSCGYVMANLAMKAKGSA